MTEVAFDYLTEARRIKEALRQEFPHDTIATDEGYKGRGHVKIVSDFFNGKSEQQKQQIIWDILRSRLGPDVQVVSLALAYGTDEL